ncbi:ABC transporter permease [Virgibacillus chiguensis]|uniref:Putative ABC transport system permease protein/putative ABC transport system permease protein n=1 Tax=Virgibacillus chiguensis TaxID=411959 RepID=A0A1M5W2G8_9BACI|nr:FtsX-like permease family protein [Virgibacillus chiguensis]SHH81685.1 putative ABC transport system permease protein/putative ABC transport system permease protein [Virgibacillus chiguensis]
MTFRQFTFNNVKRNTRAYLSYFLSCMFAVIVFFMYAVVIFHPEIATYDFIDAVKSGIIASEVIIYLFSFLFVLYSTSAFIKSRKKEYGILTTLGISKFQLNRMLILENTIIGLTSIVAGILVGALFTKLFLMIFSVILGTGEVFSFYLSWKAIAITVILFFFMFEINSLLVVLTLRTKSVMEVFRGAQAPRKKPRFSWIISVLALAAVTYSYYLAYTADLISMTYRMFIILALIIPGTYFLFTQFSIALTSFLQSRKRIFYKRLNLLIISDLTYKLKDNAKLLSMVTILSAVAFTSSGVLYGLFQAAEEESERFVPQDYSLLAEGEENKAEFNETIQEVESIFRKSQMPFQSLIIPAVKTSSTSNIAEWDDVEVFVFGFSDYNKMMDTNKQKQLEALKNNEAILLTQEVISPYIPPIPNKLQFFTGKKEIELKIELKENTTNATAFWGSNLVVSDSTFNKLQKYGEEAYYYTANIPNWIEYVDEIEQAEVAASSDAFYKSSRAVFYTGFKEAVSYLFFFGIFISVLFFLAAGSILYFRMYQGIDKDIAHYYSLYRIGLTNKEMKKIATRQIAFLFFLPFFVAVIHAAFAYKALQNMLASSVLIPSMYIISFYFIVHFINFIFIRNFYLSRLKKAARSSAL